MIFKNPASLLSIDAIDEKYGRISFIIYEDKDPTTIAGLSCFYYSLIF